MTIDRAREFLAGGIRPQVDREIVARRGLHEFVKRAWPMVVPEKFKDNWHIVLICREIERLFRGETRKLCIMVPPGCSKSLICQVFFPNWAWALDPSEKFIWTTFEHNLCVDFARQQRDLVMSPWYQERWPECCIPHQNTKAAALFRNNHKGFRASCGTGGAVTGRHAGLLCMDDPVKVQDAIGPAAVALTEINKAWDFWAKTLVTREKDSKTTRRLMIMQRVHHEDPAGRWIRSDPGVTVLCLPMEYDPDHPYIHPDDPRTEPGELLWPAHKPREAVDELKRSLGPFDAAAQLQQLPGRIGGEVFQLAWLSHTFRSLRSSEFASCLISCDLTFGGKSDSASYVAVGVWVLVGADAYRIDGIRQRMSYVETKTALRTIAAKYRHLAPIVLVENKANGAAVLDDLKRDIPGMIAAEPKGSKLARAHSVTGYFEAGNVILPDIDCAKIDGNPIDTSWVADYRLELNRFTGSAADISDQVDETSQALGRLFRSGGGFSSAMRNARKVFRL